MVCWCSSVCRCSGLLAVGLGLRAKDERGTRGEFLRLPTGCVMWTRQRGNSQRRRQYGDTRVSGLTETWMRADTWGSFLASCSSRKFTRRSRSTRRAASRQQRRDARGCVVGGRWRRRGAVPAGRRRVGWTVHDMPRTHGAVSGSGSLCDTRFPSLESRSLSPAQSHIHIISDAWSVITAGRSWGCVYAREGAK